VASATPLDYARRFRPNFIVSGSGAFEVPLLPYFYLDFPAHHVSVETVFVDALEFTPFLSLLRKMHGTH
jgi:hypothetical protein